MHPEKSINRLLRGIGGGYTPWNVLRVRGRVDPVFKEMLKSIKPNDLILDVGCGISYISVKLHKVTGCENIGIDRTLETLKWIKSQGAPGQYIYADIYHLPFQKEIFHSVICTEVLEHLLRPNLALSEVKNVLKSKGRVYITVPNEFTIQNAIRLLFKKRGPLKNRKEGEHVQAFSFLSISRLITETNFGVSVLKGLLFRFPFEGRFERLINRYALIFKFMLIKSEKLAFLRPFCRYIFLIGQKQTGEFH